MLDRDHSAHTRVLNMPELQKVLKNNDASKMLDMIPNIPQVLNMPRF